jgi:hypothetical protein
VLLAYHLPRVPSRPRLALWRALRRLGALQLNDGLVALPANAETREQLEWLASSLVDDGGSATTWVATSLTSAQERSLVGRMTEAIESEYAAVRRRATEARHAEDANRRRVLKTLRDELRRIARRDYFRVPGSAAAIAAVERLARVEAKAAI